MSVPAPRRRRPPGGRRGPRCRRRGLLGLLVGGEQVEQQCAEAGPVQRRRDRPVARAVPAAPRAVGEHHECPGVPGRGEGAGQIHSAGLHQDIAGEPGPRLSRAGQQRDDFLVRGLVEVPVPLAHRREPGRRRQAHQLVGLLAQPGRGGRWRDGHGQHHMGGALRPRHRAGGERGRAGGDAVVHEDHRASFEGMRGRSPRNARARRDSSTSSACWTEATSDSDTPARRTMSSLMTRTPPSPMAPKPSSGWCGTPSLRTTITSSGAPSSCATRKATGTPPRGRPSTTGSLCARGPRASASRRPASARSANSTGLTSHRREHVAATRLVPGDTPPSFPSSPRAGRAQIGGGRTPGSATQVTMKTIVVNVCGVGRTACRPGRRAFDVLQPCGQEGELWLIC